MANDQLLRRLPLVVALEELPEGGDLANVPLKPHKEINHAGIPGVGISVPEHAAIDHTGIPGVGGGAALSFAIIADQKTAGTSGGANTPATTFNTRELNTELHDPDSIVSIASDQFTLQAGTYLIEARTQATQQTGAARIRNITDGVTEIVGTRGGSDTEFTVIGVLTIASEKVFEVQLWTQNIGGSFGAGSTGEVNIFSTVKITKLS